MQYYYLIANLQLLKVINMSKADELHERVLVKLTNQESKDSLWNNYAGYPLQEVYSLYITHEVNKIIQLSPNTVYSSEFKDKLRSRIAEFLGVGFFLYCIDEQDIRNNDLIKHEKIGLKDYLLRIASDLEDNNIDIQQYNPEQYVFDAMKGLASSLMVIQKNEHLFDDLEDENQQGLYLSMTPFIIIAGYILAKQQDVFGRELTPQ